MGIAFVATNLHIRDRDVLCPKRIEILGVREVITVETIRTLHHFIDLFQQTFGRISPDFFALFHWFAISRQVGHIPTIEITDAILRGRSWSRGSDLSSDDDGSETNERNDSFHDRMLPSNPAVRHRRR